MNEARAVLKKQMIDTRKNKAVLTQFILFPVMTIVMTLLVKMDDMPEFFYLKLFSVMYLAMAPITSMSAIISEEKEKGTLRALMMSDVSGAAYLLGIGLYDFFCCMACTVLMSRVCGLEGDVWRDYLWIMAMGFLISIVLGSAIGVLSKNQMNATSLSVPIMCVFSFLPMIAQFNSTVEKIAKFFFTEQIYLALNREKSVKMDIEGISIVMANAILILIFFILAYRKEGLKKN